MESPSLNQSGVATEIPQNPTDLCWTHASIANGLLFTVVNTTGQGGYKNTVSNADTDETLELPKVTLPCTAKYKVIRTVAAYDGPLTMWRHSIVTLGASLWSDYRNIPLLKQLWNSKSVCINGTLYLMRFCLRNNAVLDAFTIKEESWYDVSYPVGLSPSRYDECHLWKVP